MSVSDRREGGGLHHPLDACIRGGTQHTQHPVAGRDDQLVGILGDADRERRGHMQHIIHARDRLGPTRIRSEVGGHELDSTAILPTGRDHRAHLVGSHHRAHRRSHPETVAQRRDEAVRSDEPRPAGDQDQFSTHDPNAIRPRPWGKNSRQPS